MDENSREDITRHLRQAASHLAEARALAHLTGAIIPGGFYDTSLKLSEREARSAADHFEALRPGMEAA